MQQPDSTHSEAAGFGSGPGHDAHPDGGERWGGERGGERGEQQGGEARAATAGFGSREGMPRNLADEVGKVRPFDAPAQEVFLNLVRTQEALANEFEQFFKSHGLSSAQYNALRILRGHAPQLMPCSMIAREMVTREPDITRLIDRLERAGFAKRQRCVEDRRVVKVCITEKALDLLHRLDSQVLALHSQQLAHMSEEELATLNALLFRARHRGTPQRRPL